MQFIDRLKDYLKKLNELKVHGEKEFLDNWKICWEIDHGLHLAVQIAIDLAREIITSSNFRKPRNYRETFVILVENKVISVEIGKEMEELAKFRNRLIHEYLFLDQKETYKIFKEKLPFLENFAEETAKFIKSNHAAVF